jgi:hypothetical protein
MGGGGPGPLTRIIHRGERRERKEKKAKGRKEAKRGQGERQAAAAVIRPSLFANVVFVFSPRSPR